MRLFKIKNPSLIGELLTVVRLDNGVLTVMDISPAPQSDAPLGDNEVMRGDIRYSILTKSDVDVASAIQSAGDHTALSITKNVVSNTAGASAAVIDVFARTLNGRMTMLEFTRSTKQVVAHVIVPFSSSSESECAILVPESVDGELDISGLDVQPQTFSSFEQAVDALMPMLSAGSVSIGDGLASVQIRLVDGSGSTVNRDVVVFVETTVGVVLTPRVSLIGGVGQAIVSVAGLPSGVQGRIKAGFRYYPGKTEASFQI